MADDQQFEIFLVSPPGFEAAVLAEAQSAGFDGAERVHGGVSLKGGWPDVWRANLDLRSPTRVLVRLEAFHVTHLAQLDKRARRFDWKRVLKPGTPVRVDASCRKSKIYHAGAVKQRFENALKDEIDARIDPDAAVNLKIRIDHDLCTISLDSSGEPLHKRGHKPAVAKAPMRETLASLFLRECGYSGAETVLDPMCGSGTFVIEAAEMALGLAPGRSRSFAFEQFAGFDAGQWQAMREAGTSRATGARFFGSDRDAGAVEMSRANAEAAGVSEVTRFEQCKVIELERPDVEPGLVIVNPPYGARIGNRKALYGVYDGLGGVLKQRFSGWRVGLVTSDPALAKATRLPFGPPGPYIDHGGIKIRLYQSGPLK